jgi:hypothetical protein
MPDLLERLGRRERRGSKPRCHLLTHGRPEEVAARLTDLIKPWGYVRPNDQWMPRGFADREEAQLHDAPCLLPPGIGQVLKTWWLAVCSPTSKTPNLDIASTCVVGDEPGLLLLEAKAHDQELIKEETGKLLRPPVSMDARRNHVRIGACIQDENLALAGATGQPWALSRDWNYQMSNRFAWAAKLAELGVPVILVYLGFLQARDMEKDGKPFADHADWERLVRSHSAALFSGDIWNQSWTVGSNALIPIIRTANVALGDGRLEVTP